MCSDSKPKPKWVKPVIILLAIIAIIFTLRSLGITQYFSTENIKELEAKIEGLGIWGPVVYILVYIFGTLFFLPGLPMTLLGGVFGAVKGTIYVSIASTLGAALAFLVARYAMRPMVEGWASKNPTFQKMDEGVKEQGWRMVMITRLVPIFPFNFQNYAYGLTKVSFIHYVLVSWICMLPGTVAYVFAGGSVVSGEGNLKKTLGYLAIAAIFFVLLSFLPGLIKKKFNVDNGIKDANANA